MRTEQRSRPQRAAFGITAALRALKPDSDECIVIPARSRSAAFEAAARLGVKITTRVTENKREVCVWRLT
jgi:hypothetical protein